MIEQKLIIKGTKILPSNVGIIKCHSALKVQLIILHYYYLTQTWNIRLYEKPWYDIMWPGCKDEWNLFSCWMEYYVLSCLEKNGITIMCSTYRRSIWYTELVTWWHVGWVIAYLPLCLPENNGVTCEVSCTSCKCPNHARSISNEN